MYSTRTRVRVPIPFVPVLVPVRGTAGTAGRRGGWRVPQVLPQTHFHRQHTNYIKYFLCDVEGLRATLHCS